MAGDIEEFLRRAAQRRAQQQSPASKPKPQRTHQTARVEPEVIEAVEVVELADFAGESVAEHVADHMQGNVFGERISHLGENVDQADDKMEQHLHSVFEHDLGQLGARTATAADSILDDDSPGQQLVPVEPTDYLALLQDPDSIRQAIILSEILARPTDRW